MSKVTKEPSTEFLHRNTYTQTAFYIYRSFLVEQN